MSVTLSDDEYEQLTELAEVGRLVEIRGESNSLENIWLAGQPVGKIIESNRRKAEARADASSGSESGGKGGENHHTEGDLLPIERLIRIEENPDLRDTIMADVTPSVERATVLFKHFPEWSKKTPSGRTVTDNLRTLLNAVTGERLAWRQVYRAMDKIEEWSKGAIQHKKTRRHGHILVASGRVSSVG